MIFRLKGAVHKLHNTVGGGESDMMGQKAKGKEALWRGEGV